MSRRQRQLDQLRSLCGSGAVARATDLAFAHFADFGPDVDVIAMLEEAIGGVGGCAELRARLEELTSIGAERDVACADARQPPRRAGGVRW